MISTWRNPVDERSREFWIGNCQRQQIAAAKRHNNGVATAGVALVFGAASNSLFENRYGFPRQAITGSHWDTGF